MSVAWRAAGRARGGSLVAGLGAAAAAGLIDWFAATEAAGGEGWGWKLGRWALVGLGAALTHDVLRETVSRGVAAGAMALLLIGSQMLPLLAGPPLASPATFALGALILRVWWRQDDLGLSRNLLLGAVVGLVAALATPSLGLLALPLSSALLASASSPRRRWLVAGGAGLLCALVLLAHAAYVRGMAHENVASTLWAGGGRALGWAVLESLFAARGGLLFWSPVLWLGLAGCGLASAAERRGVLLSAIAAAFLVTGLSRPVGGSGPERYAALAPVFALGLGLFLERLRALVQRRPYLLIGATGLVLAAWNALFMEQFRRGMVPRDDTIAFSQALEGSAQIVSSSFGSPPAWPASWILAGLYGVPAVQWDELAGLRLFSDPQQNRARVKSGEPPFDPALLAEGWSSPRTHESAVCRRIIDRARLLVPLERPEPLDLRLRAVGVGSLIVRVNGQRAAELPLESTLVERQLQVPATSWKCPLNEVVLEVPAPGEGWVEWLELQRPPRPSL